MCKISVILKSTDEFECILWRKRCRHFDSRSLFDNCPSRRCLGLRAASARHRGRAPSVAQPELCSPPGGTRSWRGARSRRAEARLAGALVARFARSHTGLERSPVKLSSWRTKSSFHACACHSLRRKWPLSKPMMFCGSATDRVTVRSPCCRLTACLCRTKAPSREPFLLPATAPCDLATTAVTLVPSVSRQGIDTGRKDGLFSVHRAPAPGVRVDESSAFT